MIQIDAEVIYGAEPEAVTEQLAGWNLDSFGDHDVAALLATLISALSESNWCASWHTGVEWSAWERANAADPAGPPNGLACSPEEHATLKRLMVRLAGGWVAWHDDPDAPDQTGVIYLDAAEWAAERARHAS